MQAATMERRLRLPPEVPIPGRELLLTSRACTDEERAAARLVPSTEVRSLAEEACKWILLSTGIVAYYEIKEWTINGSGRTFRSDFQLELTLNGAQVFVDPHWFARARDYYNQEMRETVDRKNAKFHTKGNEFHVAYKDEVHWVVICDNPNARTMAMADENWKASIPLPTPLKKYMSETEKLGGYVDGLIRRSDQSYLFLERSMQEQRNIARSDCMQALADAIRIDH